ncbi:MAG: hypothetical protein KBC69_00130 [Candidatus Magasanikbacteria bacterium]|nr:hypothetical protein [Candidatus Magasanikbacteria bacterium]
MQKRKPSSFMKLCDDMFVAGTLFGGAVMEIALKKWDAWRANKDRHRRVVRNKYPQHHS